MSPLVLVLFIVLAVGLGGAVVAYVRDRRRFAGYGEVMRESLALAQMLRGEVFRDGEDLVISGEFAGTPVVIRLSQAENTPGLNIRMGAPATFSVAVFPRAARAYEGRALVKTPDENFNARFEARTDQPTEARMLFDSRAAMEAVRTICRSSHDYLSIGRGAIEFSALGFPDRETTRAVRAQLQPLVALHDALATMPGAAAVRIDPRPHDRHIALRLAIVCGVIAAGLAIYIGVHPQAAATRDTAPALPAGITQEEADRIGNLEGWRLATESDLSPTAREWLGTSARQFEGRVNFDATGAASTSTAYLLINAAGEQRLVLLINDSKAFDSRFAQVAGLARVPRAEFATLAWDGPVPAPAGDGILLVRDAADHRSGVVFFQHESAITSASPLDYQQAHPEL